MANHRKKRKDSSYFKSGDTPTPNKPMIGKKWHKDLIDVCAAPWCGKEVHWEEAVTFGPAAELYHPECLKEYRSRIERLK